MQSWECTIACMAPTHASVLPHTPSMHAHACMLYACYPRFLVVLAADPPPPPPKRFKLLFFKCEM